MNMVNKCTKPNKNYKIYLKMQKVCVKCKKVCLKHTAVFLKCTKLLICTLTRMRNLASFQSETFEVTLKCGLPKPKKSEKVM